jgi:hypothetical protein
MARLRRRQRHPDFAPSGFCALVSPDAGAREGARMRLAASVDNMHLIEDASGRVI